MALKENIRVEGKRDVQTKVRTTLFALFGEVERDPPSERTGAGPGRSGRVCSAGRRWGLTGGGGPGKHAAASTVEGCGDAGRAKRRRGR